MPPSHGVQQKIDALQLGSLAVLTQQGTVKGYSKTQVNVLFTPTAQGPVKQSVEINFRFVYVCFAAALRAFRMS